MGDGSLRVKGLGFDTRHIYLEYFTDADGAWAKSSANVIVGIGFASRYRLITQSGVF